MPALQSRSPVAPAGDLLRRAAAKRDKRRWEQAEQLYRQALANEPGNPEALHGLGTVASLQGRFQDAIPNLATALKHEPHNADLWFSLADALIRCGRLAETRLLLERFVGQDLSGPTVSDLKRRFVATLLASAIRHHDGRRLSEAEALYDIVLLLDAENADALHLAGSVALDGGRLDLAADLATLAVAQKGDVAVFHQSLGQARHRQGRLDEARTSFQKAVELEPADPKGRNNLASTLQDLGRFAEAEAELRRALALDPGYALAWNNLGLALVELDRLPEAIDAYERALRISPSYPAALCHLGLALGRSGRPEDAAQRYREALRIDPDHAFALNNLGNLLRDTGQPDEALVHLTRAVALRPDLADVHSNLATTLMAVERLDEAKASLREAVRIAPSDPNLHYNLGNLLSREFRFRQALDAYAVAVEQKPDFVEALNNVADAYRIMTLNGDAEEVLRRAIEVDPGYAAAHNNLGNVLRSLDRMEEAAECFERAVELTPTQSETRVNLALTYKDLGRTADAIAAYEAALRCHTDRSGDDLADGELGSALESLRQLITEPDGPSLRNMRSMGAYNQALFNRLYLQDVSPEELAADSRLFGERFADPLLRRRPFRNDRDPDRRLKIGFVSADLRQHSVNFFFEPAFNHLPKDAFETYAYSNTILVDDATDRLRPAFDRWTCIRRMSDEAVADRIEADGIDILVDLSGHTAGNRLPVFARKPAPVQVTWIGYPGSVGMKAIDYRLADLTEPDGAEALSVEALWRMPNMAICYQPHSAGPAVIDHPPCDDNGHVTFGCFNNFAKLTDATLQTWARIMERVPGSRLLLEIANIERPQIRKTAEERFVKAGLPLDRIDLKARVPENQYVLYNRIDIALDPFPYNGGTTSMDTLWMGVPLVSLTGGHLVARMGYGLLTTVGLPELAAPDTDAYVAIASDLALDRARLRAIRHDLRGRMERSPMMDHPRFGRDLGDAFRGMWSRWVAAGAEAPV